MRNSYHFPDDTDEILPLSGHSFSVVQSASGGNANLVNPPRRDVVASGAGATNNQSVRIRFRTDNPGKQWKFIYRHFTGWLTGDLGPWFIHCHIDWHRGELFY